MALKIFELKRCMKRIQEKVFTDTTIRERERENEKSMKRRKI